MHISMIAACLVLFVAISDVSAQGQFGIGGLQNCMCNNGGYCQQTANGLMCVLPTGGSYVPQFLGQGMVGQGMVGQGMVGQGLVGQGLLGQGLVGQGLVGQGLLGQGLVNQGLVGKRLIGAKSIGGRAPCCQRQDYQLCAVQGYTNLNSYTTGGICNKYFFNGSTCEKIQVYTSCVAALNPANLFKNPLACTTKCSPNGLVGY